jgi:subtilisin family serine protease
MRAAEFSHLISSRPAQLLQTPLKPVTVAVLDTGVDATHPDLGGKVLAAYAVKADAEAKQIPLANNDGFGHGTSVSGIILRTAPNARIIDVRVLDEHNQGTVDSVLAGMSAAIAAGAKVLNMSLALSEDDEPKLLRAMEHAYQNNVIVVAAQKNLPIGDNGLPAQLSTSIGVGNSSELMEGEWRFDHEIIEVSACGTELLSPAAGGGYRRVTGTSFATPFVSGICCIALGAIEDLASYEMKTLLKHWAAITQSRGLLDTTS